MMCIYFYTAFYKNNLDKREIILTKPINDVV